MEFVTLDVRELSTVSKKIQSKGGGDVTPDILSRRRFSHMDREISTHIQRHRPRETERVQTSTLTFVHQIFY